MGKNLLTLLEIKKVYFGCWNERFGGNGSILETQTMVPNNYQTIGRLQMNSPKILFLGGLKEEEAKNLLKKFYEKGNENLPEEMRHRTKKIKNEDEK